MFNVCKHQFLSALVSPRFYIALLVGIVVHSLNILPLLELSKAIDKPVGITEGFLLFNNDIFSLAAASLGIIILISDIKYLPHVIDCLFALLIVSFDVIGTLMNC